MPAPPRYAPEIPLPFFDGDTMRLGPPMPPAGRPIPIAGK